MPRALGYAQDLSVPGEASGLDIAGSVLVMPSVADISLNAVACAAKDSGHHPVPGDGLAVTGVFAAEGSRAPFSGSGGDGTR